ncbi:hypothetical protein EB796_016326 [Bugula neritina]|uniref:Uncharacterized protein n=1 Tax=Bugula neritina TaxID=10212 RepID=A0A7J7JGY2_BUGNE|nr:hypothetical protein EB796_016326 [Bugula neritina]
MLSLSQLLVLDAATDASECGVAINLTGNMQCLEEYALYVNTSFGIPEKMNIIIMAVETVPIDTEFYVSLGTGDLDIIGTPSCCRNKQL